MILDENTRFCGSFPIIVFENQRFWTKIRGFAAHFLSEKKSNYFQFENRIIALSALVIQGMRPALRAGLSGGSSLGQRPATLFFKRVRGDSGPEKNKRISDFSYVINNYVNASIPKEKTG